MYNNYTWRQVCLMNRLRNLWQQHVYWTRFFIISTAADLGDLDPVTKRLLRNPGDFAEVLTPFYGTQIADQFKDLFTQHLMIAGDLVNAAKNKETAAVNETRQKWYDNADSIARFLADINPYWNETRWRSFLYDHLYMTEQEATLRLGGNYKQDIQTFDQIEEEALQMADYMSQGIIRQFDFR